MPLINTYIYCKYDKYLKKTLGLVLRDLEANLTRAAP